MNTYPFQTTSPPNFGASITDHTDDTLLICSDYIKKNSDDYLTYANLQQILYSKHGISKSNFRCIMPLMKSFSFIQFEAKRPFYLRDFFTDLGKAYIKVLRQRLDIISSSHVNKAQVLKTVDNAIRNIRLLGLENCLKDVNTDVSSVYIITLAYLLKFSRIDKFEFPFLWYHYQLDPKNYLDNMQETVLRYRQNNLQLQPILIKQKEMDTFQGQSSYHQQAPGFSYILKTLEQCGLVFKETDSDYFSILPSKTETITRLLEKSQHE